MNAEQLKSLKRVIDYLADEESHFKESGCPKKHIYNDVVVLQSLWQANTGLQADGSWACRNCGYRNNAKHLKCHTCGLRRR